MKAIHVNIIGAGGTGAWAAEQILRSAMGMRSKSQEHAIIINLIDNDRIELRNLVRQHFIGIEAIGMPKVEYLKMKLERILAAAMFSVDENLKDNNNDTYMPGIRIDSYEQLVLEDEDGELPQEMQDILFPLASAGSIVVTCVDNNLTRKTLEKHYHRHLAEECAISTFNDFAQGSEGLVGVVDDLFESDPESQTSIYYVLTETGVNARIITKDEKGVVTIAPDIPADYLRPLLTKTSLPELSPMYAYIDAGNDDTAFSINGALNTQLADYTHVYDDDLTVPDALLSCAVSTETTPVPQTATMNMMAAVHLASVVSQWIISMRDTTQNYYTKFNEHDIILYKNIDSAAETVLLDVAGAGYKLIPIESSGIQHTYSGAQEMRRTLLKMPSGKITPTKILEAYTLELGGDTKPSKKDAVELLQKVVDDDSDTYETNIKALVTFDDDLDLSVDGVSITGTSTTSKLLARSRQKYKMFRDILKKSVITPEVTESDS